MAPPSHRYEIRLEWTGAGSTGTRTYGAYARSYTVRVEGKAELFGSADPVYRGDPSKVNPEDLLLASLSACHMLWYLHLCAEAKVVVTRYCDLATGILVLDRELGGRFSEVTLRPRVDVSSGDLRLARALHEEARRKCFIANSVNFPVRHEPLVEAATPTAPAAGE